MYIHMTIQRYFEPASPRAGGLEGGSARRGTHGLSIDGGSLRISCFSTEGLRGYSR